MLWYQTAGRIDDIGLSHGASFESAAQPLGATNRPVGFVVEVGSRTAADRVKPVAPSFDEQSCRHVVGALHEVEGRNAVAVLRAALALAPEVQRTKQVNGSDVPMPAEPPHGRVR